MADDKVFNCWVVVEDCSNLVGHAENSTHMYGEGEKLEDVNTSAVTSDEPRHGADDRCGSVKPWPEAEGQKSRDALGAEDEMVSGQVTRVSADKSLKLKKHPFFTKTHKKKGQVINPAASAHVKEQLMQRYGSSLLRKPSFLHEIETEVCQLAQKWKSIEGKGLNQRNDPRTGKKNGVDKKNFTSHNSTATHTFQPTPVQLDKKLIQKFTVGPKTSKLTRDSNISTSKEARQPDCDPLKDPTNLSNDAPNPPEDCERFQTVIEDDDGPNDAREVIEGPVNQCYTNPTHPMPAVGLTLDVGLGRKLKSLEAKCVLTCLDDCKSSISPQYATFCASVIKSSARPLVQKVILPIKDKRILQFMDIKWKSKSVVKKCSIPGLLTSKGASCGSGSSGTKFSYKGFSSSDMHCKKPVMDEEQMFSTFVDCGGQTNLSSIQKVCGEIDEDTQVGSDLTDKENGDTGICDSVARKNPKYSSLRRMKRSLVQRNGRKKLNQDPGFSKFTSQMDSLDRSVDPERMNMFPRKRAKLTLLGAHVERLQPCNKQEGENKDCTDGSFLLKRQVNSIDGESSPQTGGSSDNKKPSQAPYDPDDTRGIDSSEEVLEEHVGVTCHRKSNVARELRRLNVAIFDVTNSHEPIHCKFPDICRLGCICSSLSSEVVRDNCGLEKCLFGCTCLKPQAFRRESFSWMQNKARANLAKEERHFKQTVIRSGNDNLVLLEGKRKRERKVPERYREAFISDVDLQVRQGSSKDQDVKHSKTPRENKDPQDLAGPIEKVTSAEKKQPLTIDEDEAVSGCSESAFWEESAADSDPGESARTVPYAYQSQTHRQEKCKQLLSDSACEKIKLEPEFQIFSPDSLIPEAWKQSTHKVSSYFGQKSCSLIFKPDFIQKEREKVVIFSWSALRNDLQNKRIYLWVKPTSGKPKLILSLSPDKPCQKCIDVQSLPEMSHSYRKLPNHLKSLRPDYISSEVETEAAWIGKYSNESWSIIGFMHHNQRTPSLCETEVDILPSFDDHSQYRWWAMDTTQDFDLIYFMDFKKAMTKRQITTLVKLSNEYCESEKKVHRILLNRLRPDVHSSPTSCLDFGAYSLPNHPSEVLIGPFSSFNEPRFQVFSEKVAHNGKAEYEKIPLFYCGGGECVRVNSRGVLSLQGEDLPEKFVQGAWYESCGNNLREVSSQVKEENYVGEQVRAGQQGLENEVIGSPALTVSESSGTSTDKRKNSDVPLHVALEGSLAVNKDLKETAQSGIFGPEKGSADSEADDTDLSQSKKRRIFFLVEPVHSTKKNVKVSLLKKTKPEPDLMLPSKPLISQLEINTPSSSKDSDDELESTKSCDSAPEFEKEYLIPNMREVGVVTITHLPSGAISVPHFTDARSLKFYQSKEDVVRDLNRLIHHKLSCLSQKCSLLLMKDELCTCVKWTFSKDWEICSRLPPFRPEIFSGFYMLTQYGLVDLRAADQKTISRLGKDWVEWLKNDEIRLKLHEWETGADVEVTEKHYDLMKVLTSNHGSNLSLLQVLVMATSEIAKLKAEDQLLDYEGQTQKLLRETLIYSLCRKLNGIPGDVVPQLLEQMELDLLWEVLECMDSRNTGLVPGKKHPFGPPASNEMQFVDNMPLSASSRGLGGINSNNTEKKKVRKMIKNEKVDQHGVLKPVNVAKRQSNLKKVSSSPATHPQEAGLVCHVSPFSRLNIKVGEGGIKRAPLSSSSLPVKPTVPASPSKISATPLSPGKPNILKKTKNIVGDQNSLERASVTSAPKQPRKQKFCLNSGNDIEADLEGPPDFPVVSNRRIYVRNLSRGFAEDCAESPATHQPHPSTSSNQGSSSLPEDSQPKLTDNQDPNSAPQISSVVSEDQDPISALWISSVVSGDQDPISAPEISSVVSEDQDPISALRISSVVSGDVPWHDDHESDLQTPLISKETSVSESNDCSTSSMILPKSPVKGSECDPISSLRISSVFSARHISAMFPHKVTPSSVPESVSTGYITSQAPSSVPKSSPSVYVTPQASPSLKCQPSVSSSSLISSVASPAIESSSSSPRSPKNVVVTKILNCADKKTTTLLNPGAQSLALNAVRLPTSSSITTGKFVNSGKKEIYFLKENGQKVLLPEAASRAIQAVDSKPTVKILKNNYGGLTLSLPMSSLGKLKLVGSPLPGKVSALPVKSDHKDPSPSKPSGSNS